MMGAIQWVPLPLPSAQAIWSARIRALLIRRTTCGTELTGYRLWSGLGLPGQVASAATCQPDR